MNRQIVRGNVISSQTPKNDTQLFSRKDTAEAPCSPTWMEVWHA